MKKLVLLAALAALSACSQKTEEKKETPAAPTETAAPAPARPPSFATAQRILILGDSITYGGNYVDFIETVIQTRAPEWRGEIISVGLSSETVSGLSEAGHAGGKFPRPDLHERLARVL
eukprot:gene46802-58368_t